jgi:alpha-ribazole phosphatase
MTITLSLIRHGQTQWNAEGRYTGQSDIPLNDVGREQARQLVKQLKENPPDVIFSSDLKRAEETAAIIANRIKVTVHVDRRLREINQGVWEGMHFDEIKMRYAEEFAARVANPLEVAPPGGETIGQVQERVLSAVAEIMRTNRGSHVAIVAHGLVLALIKAQFENYPISQIWDLIPSNAQAEVVHPT